MRRTQTLVEIYNKWNKFFELSFWAHLLYIVLTTGLSIEKGESNRSRWKENKFIEFGIAWVCCYFVCISFKSELKWQESRWKKQKKFFAHLFCNLKHPFTCWNHLCLVYRVRLTSKKALGKHYNFYTWYFLQINERDLTSMIYCCAQFGSTMDKSYITFTELILT